MKTTWRFAGGILTALAAVAGPAAAGNVNVTANITTSQTWTADNEYILGTVIYVTSGATLTIEPGTVVRGLPDASTPGANDPGTLVITRGSKIQALGTAYKPIVFTDQLDDNIGSNPGTFPYGDKIDARGLTGQWGGLIVLGRSYVANNTLSGPNAAREVQIEGLNAAGGLGLYGNCTGTGLTAATCDDDDSGTLQYVSIRYGGFNLSANNEINGLTLGAVGRQTDVHHVEVFQNKDDGIELFGGTVNLKNVVVASAGDDSIDWDEGYRGKQQFVFALQGTPGTDKSDKGGEWDGGNAPDGSQPRAIPTVYNATFVGLGQKSFTDSTANTALHIRDNSGGRVYNSAFLDFGGTDVLIEGGATGTAATTSGERSITAYTANTGNCSATTGTVCDDNGDCPGGETCVLHYGGPASAFQLELQDNTFWCIKRQELLGGVAPFPPGGDRPAGVLVTQGVCSNSGVACLTSATCGAGNCDDAPEDWGITLPGDNNKVHHDNGMYTTAALDNAYVTCASATPIRTLSREIDPDAGDPNPVGTVDPRPATGSPLLTTNRTPPADGFFDPAPYRGAFGSQNWAADWTALSRLGYFPPKPQVNVTANITTSQTWTADNEYILGTVIYVTSGATLTIEPGTVVRGLPDASTPGANDPGTLVITRGSKIQALGTEDRPIILTDQGDSKVGTAAGEFPYDTAENARGLTGQWGGLIVLGRSYVANNTLSGPNAAREVQIEGLNAAGGLGLYGNCTGTGLTAATCDDDDSGTLQYVSIRYGGFNLSANNEINGLTLGAVGRQTDVHHVEVFQNKDDGIELFGGTVNLKNVVVASAGDDSIDWDEGYRGKQQFVFALQGTPGTDKSDKGGEWDGGNAPDGSQPRAIPTVYNATFVGLGQKSFTDSTANTALHIRDNSGGRVYNSAFLDFGGTDVLIEGGATGTAATTSGERSITAYTANTGNCSATTGTVCDDNGDCPGGETCVLHYGGPASAFQLELQDNTFWCIKRQELLGGVAPFPPGGDRPAGVLVTQGVCSNSGVACLTSATCGAGNCDDAPEDWGITLPGDNNKVHHDNGMYTTAALDNAYVTCASATPIRTLSREIDPDAGDPNPVGTVDPRPATGSPLLTTNRTPPADGFFDPAPYRGAFGSQNWMANWTNISRLGYFATCAGSSNATPDEVQGLRYSGDKSTLSWSEPGLPGMMGVQLFDVLRKSGANAAAAADFTTASCHETNDTDTRASDSASPSAGQAFFYLIRAGNTCGEGTLGYRSNGAERAGASCP